eukprot:TRINITY_DN17411_c0_g1_i1.p1 TRINITY_DN17411_c0_g1~~TRINITY_DN17411_c0_g1_i1.p1  ORF type:complete len:249 (-),score=36.59 TRINITY_DN17411_c0_g1_i1:58-804(-)
MGGAVGRGVDPPEPSVGALDAPRFPQRIGQANTYVETEYQGMVAAHHQLKALARQREQAFRALAEPLSKECKNIHDNLKALADAQGSCQKAQEASLPKLFELKGDGKYWGSLTGCAQAQKTEGISEQECQCAAGTMSAGCKDTEATTDHRLICTHVREALLPELKLRRLFSPGNPCAVDAKAKYNEALLPTGEPTNFKLPGAIAEEIMPLAPETLVILARSIVPPIDAADGKRLHTGRAGRRQASAFL